MKVPTPFLSGSSRGLEIRFVGPEAGPGEGVDLRQLCSDQWPRDLLRRRLRAWPCVVATVDGHLVALATCQNVACEMRVQEFAIDVAPARTSVSRALTVDGIIDAVLEAIELMALAGGCRRIVLIPPRDAIGSLERHAYAPLDAGPGGFSWFEKRIG